jgi:hypothetical protein
VPTSLARLFPGHPGLSWNVRLNLSTSAARSVLSMNWEQTNRFLFSFNDLICTAYSPNRACEKPVNNANQPVKSSDSHFANADYSPLFRAKNSRGEQVLLWKFEKFQSSATRSDVDGSAQVNGRDEGQSRETRFWTSR